MPYHQDDGWIQVRYGGRRGRPLDRTFQAPRKFPRGNYSWDRGGRGPGWKASAPPVSRTYGGQGNFFLPNRPVPPPGFSAASRPPQASTYIGQQSRSYADVTRQNLPRSAPTGQNFVYQHQTTHQDGQQRNVGGFSRDDNRRTTPTDPTFGLLVRKLHKVIKVVHHLQNVTPTPGKSNPKMISRMVDVLSSMIKPASPTQETVEMIVGNAKNWGHNTLIILEDHYKEVLDTLLIEISNHLTPEWKVAFDVATKWARKNLPRIQQDVIDHAAALITACAVSEQQSGGHNHQHAQTTDINTQPVPQQQQQVTQTVPTMTEPTVARPPQAPHTTEPPKAQRTIRRRSRYNPCVLPDNVSFQVIEDEQQRPVDNEASILENEVNVQESLIDLGIAHPTIDTTPPLSPVAQQPNVSTEQTTAMVHMSPQTDEVAQQGDVISEHNDSEVRNINTPRIPKTRVTRHINTDRKMVEWGLSVRKKWLIIGDSNLARIPGYSIPDLQIESYPGANFRHAHAILSKASKHVTVEKVVLSFGMNSRGQKAKETAIKQMQAALRMAKRTFPYSEIWIPTINYSVALPHAEQVTLSRLNTHLQKNMPFIPPLRNSYFHTESDNVHWTKGTARAMLDYWVTYLNLKAP